MILPSDEDSRPPDGPGEPDDPPPWPVEPEPPGFFGEEEHADPSASATVHNPAPEGWREDLSEDLDDALDELKEIEDPAEDFDPPEPPDLFAFYGELVAMRNDFRRGAAALAQSLHPGAAGAELPRGGQEVVAALVKLHDDFSDTNKALVPLLAPAMKAAGLVRIKVKAGANFDPALMSTDDKVRPGCRIAREIYSGWYWNGLVIRTVHVALK